MDLRTAKRLQRGRRVDIPHARLYGCEVNRVIEDRDPRVKLLVEVYVKDEEAEKRNVTSFKLEQFNYRLCFEQPVRL
jgi:hypothetical protein